MPDPRPYPSSPGDEYDDGSEDGPSSSKKSRSLNCAECRRLKIKCDRKIPCQGCIKRGYPELCPDRALGGLKGLIKERDDLAERVQHLENILSQSANHLSHRSSFPSHPSQDFSFHFPPPTPSGPLGHFSSPSRGGPHPHHMPMGYMSPHVIPDMNVGETSHLGIGGATGMDALASAASRSPRVVGPEPTPSTGGHEVNPQNDSGTLVVISGGRSTWVGPSAGMQWLRDDMLRGSTARNPNVVPLQQPEPVPLDFGLPISQPDDNSYDYAALHATLPSLEEARLLVQSYFRRVAWIGSSVSAAEMDTLLRKVYVEREPSTVSSTDRLSFQEMGLVAAVLAAGTVVNMELPPLDSQAVKLVALAQYCLIAGRFMLFTSLTMLDTLSLLCKVLPYVDLYNRWDYAWELWGVTTRIMQAMGLHRDGHTWNLDEREVDKRRRLFWDIHTSDIFMSANWDRVTGLATDQFDTLFPQSWIHPTPTFESVLSQLACLAKECLDETHKVTPPPYGKVVDLWRRLCTLEDEMPFYLRCRASMKAMVSKYANAMEAERASPPPNSADVALVFQQHYLVLKTCTTIYALLRPYFVSALRDSPAEPTRSPFAAPFLAVVERSSMMVAALQSLYTLSPLVSLRHWFFWSDGFSAATCLGIICIVAPGCSLVPLAMRDFDAVISLLPHVRESLPREVTRKDIEWLLTLHDKAVAAVETYHNSRSNDETSPYNSEKTDAELNMAGWRTRLIKRAVHPPAEEPTSETKSTSDIGGPLLDPSWWDGLLPSTMGQEAELTGGMIFGTGSSDWLQQILDLPSGGLSGSATPAVAPDAGQVTLNGQGKDNAHGFDFDNFWRGH